MSGHPQPADWRVMGKSSSYWAGQQPVCLHYHDWTELLPCMSLETGGGAAVAAQASSAASPGLGISI